MGPTTLGKEDFRRAGWIQPFQGGDVDRPGELEFPFLERSIGVGFVHESISFDVGWSLSTMSSGARAETVTTECKKQFGTLAASSSAAAAGHEFLTAMYTLLRPNIDQEHDLQLAAFDARYLERLQAADVRTEQHFVGYFSELIRLKLRSRLSSPEAIEDARQETFVRVFALIRARDGIRQPERLGALVNSVCNNVLLEHYRSKSRREAPLDEELEDSFIAEGPGPADVMEQGDTQRLVGKILGDLPERDRRILRAVLLEERDKDQVCTELGISREYLRLLVHRAKQSFKASYLKRLRDKGDL